jgi:hypothetical protein
MGGELFETAGVGAANFLLDQAKGKDRLVRMAQTLALLAHGRAAWLTRQALSQTEPRCLSVCLQGAEKATSTFMQLTRAIGENGQPKNPSTKILIGQANVAQQQVVQNIPGQKGKQGDHGEQTRIEKNEPAIDAEIVSAVSGGIGVAEAGNPQKSPLGPEHRPKNAGGKSTGFSERFNTRRKVRRHRSISTIGKKHD